MKTHMRNLVINHFSRLCSLHYWFSSPSDSHVRQDEKWWLNWFQLDGILLQFFGPITQSDCWKKRLPREISYFGYWIRTYGCLYTTDEMSFTENGRQSSLPLIMKHFSIPLHQSIKSISFSFQDEIKHKKWQNHSAFISLIST
jgi:hypothetical protein